MHTRRLMYFPAKLGYCLYFILCFFRGFTQFNPIITNLELRLLAHNKISHDIEFKITSQFSDNRPEIHHVYVQQYLKNLPLIPVTAAFHFDSKNNLIYATGNLRERAEDLLLNKQHILSMEKILLSVLKYKEVNHTNYPFIENRTKNEQDEFSLFYNSGLKKDEFKIRKCYYLLSDQFILPAYQLHWKRNGNGEWLEMIIEAERGRILFEYNHLLQCNFEHTIFDQKSLFTISENTDLSAPPNSYNVFPLPVESPIHGTRSIVTSPWSKAANASPSGWHHNGYSQFYTTRGNNVDAYEDSDDTDYPTGGDASRAYGGTQLNFDFSWNSSMPPMSNKDASLTNLFYWINVFHYVWYQYGFTEQAGNFQYHNFNKGGLAFDHIIAEGLDNIQNARNNANFGTPPDGYSGVMQLYVWQPPEKDTLIIESPSSIAGKIMYVHTPVSQVIYAPINRQVVQVSDGSSYPTYACNNLINGAQLNGKIAMVDRGICSFSSKLFKVQSAGAVAMIICNNDDNEPTGFGGWNNGITIPAVMIRKSDCQKIKLQLQNGVFISLLPSSALKFKVNQRSLLFSRAQFGGKISNVTTDIVNVYDNANLITDACDFITNGNEINGKMALIDEGNCEPSYKAMQAQNHGAVAVIICKQSGGYPDTIPRGSYGHLINIPVIGLSQSDCQMIRASWPVRAQLSNTMQQLTDGDFDAGIICHEYAHGLTNRLTGGPGNSSCLSNAEQMGEGWSDYFGLIMTIRNGDHAFKNRGIGVYNSGHSISGVGLRPYPYNVDLTVNPANYTQLTDIVNISQPHGIGYIWCSMLWDLTWAMINQHGFEIDIYNSNSTKGNIKAYQLVINGLKLQTCSPGFVDGRNAILKADSILYGGIHSCLIWNVFARRGLGISANQGSSFRRDDGTAAYDIPNSCSPMSDYQLFLSNSLAAYDLTLTASVIHKSVELEWTIDPKLQSEKWIIVKKGSRSKKETVLVKSEDFTSKNFKYNDTDILTGEVYYYQLRVLKSTDKSIYSKWIHISVDGEKDYWTCHPNPVSDVLTIYGKNLESGSYEIVLYNQQLQLVEKINLNYKPGIHIQLNCSALSAGHYYLLIGAGNAYNTLRFFKN
jgi:hypothetical protein